MAQSWGRAAALDRIERPGAAADDVAVLLRESVDDFGTRHASRAHLSRLPVVPAVVDVAAVVPAQRSFG